MKIEIADINGIGAIAHMCSEYFSEHRSWDKITYSPDKTLQTLLMLHNDEDSVIVIARDDDGTPIGFSMWNLESLWTVEKVATEIMFYVRKEYRGCDAARELIKYTISVCESAGAKVFHASSTGEIDGDGKGARAFNMMMASVGFKGVENSKFLIKKVS